MFTALYKQNWMSAINNIWCLTFKQCSMLQYELLHLSMNFADNVTKTGKICKILDRLVVLPAYLNTRDGFFSIVNGRASAHNSGVTLHELQIVQT